MPLPASSHHGHPNGERDPQRKPAPMDKHQATARYLMCGRPLTERATRNP